MSKSHTPSVGRSLYRSALGPRVALALALTAGLAACGDSRAVGSVGYVKGFGGLVAADEPQAVVVARDVLSAGGTAADAAVALYFTLAVTQPSTASLGGGGVCLVHDKKKKITEVVDFLPRAASGAAGIRLATSVPGAVRGFYALHAKYGKFRWESLLGEGEKLARLGTPVSRAFAADLAIGGRLLANDPVARQVFFPGGRLLVEGQSFEQHDLAAVYARIRRSPGEFYNGSFAQSLADAVGNAGGTLSTADLINMRPNFTPTQTVKHGDEVIHFAPPPAVSGAVAARMVAALEDRWEKTPVEERPHLLAEISARAFAERGGWMNADGSAKPAFYAETGKALATGYDPDRHQPVQGDRPNDALPASSFVVLDGDGNGVACNVTTYGLFGTGRMLSGTGIFMAAAPGVNSGPPAVGPVMVINPHVQEVRFAAAASGGVTGASAMTQVLLENQLGGVKLGQALAAPRLHHSGNPDILFVEEGSPGEAALTKRGHQVKTVAMPSRVNALRCDTGRPNFGKCQVEADPRGAGMAVVVGRD
ncbi:gamma-glutamyltransferase [Magnetospirillum sulfuroxidans]|uniref:gamma-glutamyltransferase n=1 Tax=Magnetospirillum sulfuroxidans TaxID=611300 RepID=UPI0031FEDC1D